MNKSEFLGELKKRISLLEDDEQQDIIDEYSQHIDTKVSKGMTESEAIEDFGPLDQLVEELLGAYHVKASAVEGAAASNASSLPEGGKRAARRAAEAAKKGCSKLKERWNEPNGKPKGKTIGSGAEKGAGDGSGEPLDAAPGAGRSRMGAAFSKTMGFAKSTGASAARGGSSLWSTVFSLTKTFIRWCWNLCVACLAAGIGSCALCSLFLFGFCLVLLLQGYPLAGASLAALGASVSLGCLGVLCIQLVPLRKKQARETPAGHPARVSEEEVR